MLGVFEKTFNLVKTALKIRSYKHSLLASNIANVDTPGYRGKDIPFEKIIQSYLLLILKKNWFSLQKIKYYTKPHCKPFQKK
jgi:flagellar basal-body rod protein FlgB